MPTSSARARRCPRHRCAPNPKATWSLGSAADVEGLGVDEDRLVAVRRRVEQEHVLPGADGLAVELDVTCGRAVHVLDGRHPAQHLLDRSGQQRPVPTQVLELVGMAQERLHPAADHVARRLVPTDEQEQRLVHERVASSRRSPSTSPCTSTPSRSSAENLRRRSSMLLPHVGVPLHEGGGGLGEGVGVGRALRHEHGVGPLEEPLPVLGVEAQHVGDHHQGERGGDVGHQVAGTLLAHRRR